MDLKLDLIGTPLTPATHTYSWKDCILYALGVGETDLRYVWESHADFAVLPSFAVVPSQPVVMSALKQVNADYMKVVHGAQSIVMHAPLARKGTLTTTGVVREIQDKGKGAVVIIDTKSVDAEGTLIFETSWSIFCRGQGGFGGERGTKPIMPAPLEGAEPVVTVMHTRDDQALLYRLSGDLNPLHIDPNLATKVGFDRPILHGLCSYGFVLRAVLDAVAEGDPKRLVRFDARFAGTVFPGDALTVQVLATDDKTTFLVQALVDDRAVLSHGVVVISA